LNKYLIHVQEKKVTHTGLEQLERDMVTVSF